MKLQIETNIKREIENIFGRSIVSSRDCVQLSNDIYLKTKHQLNPNTLRRFFGLVKSDHSASRTTLDILSRYCGYHSIGDVADKSDFINEDVKEIQGGIGSFMVSLFRDVPVDSREDKTFLSVVFNTVQYLNRYPTLARQFQAQVAKTKNGQEFYFEKFVNIDKLDGYYGDGMRYYYAEKKTPEAQVFAHALMVYRYWLTGNDEKFTQHYETMLQHSLDETATPFIYGRLLAARILHAQRYRLPAEAIIQEAYRYYFSLPTDQSHASFPRFELYLSEALMLTGHIDEAMQFVELAKKWDTAEDEYNHWKFYQNFLLLETFAACKQQEFKRAEVLFEKIDPSQFYFLRRAFSNILYLQIMRQVKRQNPKHEEQLDELISQTGFVQLRHLF